jgi:hypothetical protein
MNRRFSPDIQSKRRAVFHFVKIGDVVKRFAARAVRFAVRKKCAEKRFRRFSVLAIAAVTHESIPPETKIIADCFIYFPKPSCKICDKRQAFSVRDFPACNDFIISSTVIAIAMRPRRV